jgi:hypothetical protein
MRVYFAAAMTSPARDLPALAAIVAHLEATGHAVPTRHVADPGGRELDAGLTDQELAQRDLGWLAESDAFVAEVSAPSHGVGIEAMAAVQRLLPVLLLHRRGGQVSRLLLGLPFVSVTSYGDVAEACSRVDEFLAAVGAASVARATG